MDAVEPEFERQMETEIPIEAENDPDTWPGGKVILETPSMVAILRPSDEGGQTSRMSVDEFKRLRGNRSRERARNIRHYLENVDPAMTERLSGPLTFTNFICVRINRKLRSGIPLDVVLEEMTKERSDRLEVERINPDSYKVECVPAGGTGGRSSTWEVVFDTSDEVVSIKCIDFARRDDPTVYV